MTPFLSVILPVYNEAECIEGVLRELLGVLRTRLDGQSFEVLTVDDGSKDDTPAILKKLRAEFPEIRILTLLKNAGQSAAFGAGFRAARAPLLVTLDADGQNDPADIPALLREMSGADAVCGFRAKRKDTWSKRIGSKLANRVRNAALGEEVVDTGCSLKIFKRELVADLPVWNGMHRFFPTWFRLHGAVIKQVAVNHRPRAAGSSKYTNFGRLKKTIRDLRGMAWLKSRYVRYEVREE